MDELLTPYPIDRGVGDEGLVAHLFGLLGLPVDLLWVGLDADL